MTTLSRILITALVIVNLFFVATIIVEVAGNERVKASPPATDTGKPVAAGAEANPSIALVLSYSCGTNRPMTGTAWVVGKNLLVTAAHVIVGGEVIAVGYGRDGSERGRVARVVGYDAATDLALLATETDSTPALPLLAADSRLRIGEGFESVGHPRSRPLEASPLVLAGQGTHERRGLIYALRGTVEPGDSGSPMMDGNGKVSGVVYGTSEDFRTAYVTPIGYVHRLIDEAAANGWATVGNGKCGDSVLF